jgi:hypothetical protein
MFFFQFETDLIRSGIRQVAQAPDHSQNKKHTGIDAECNTGFTFLDFIQRRTANGGTLRSAIMAIGIRLRRRASRISRPSLLRARLTGMNERNRKDSIGVLICVEIILQSSE